MSIAFDNVARHPHTQLRAPSCARWARAIQSNKHARLTSLFHFGHFKSRLSLNVAAPIIPDSPNCSAMEADFDTQVIGKRKGVQAAMNCSTNETNARAHWFRRGGPSGKPRTDWLAQGLVVLLPGNDDDRLDTSNVAADRRHGLIEFLLATARDEDVSSPPAPVHGLPLNRGWTRSLEMAMAIAIVIRHYLMLV
jgi:hypothetical protein